MRYAEDPNAAILSLVCAPNAVANAVATQLTAVATSEDLATRLGAILKDGWSGVRPGCVGDDRASIEEAFLCAIATLGELDALNDEARAALGWIVEESRRFSVEHSARAAEALAKHRATAQLDSLIAALEDAVDYPTGEGEFFIPALLRQLERMGDPRGLIAVRMVFGAASALQGLVALDDAPLETLLVLSGRPGELPVDAVIALLDNEHVQKIQFQDTLITLALRAHAQTSRPRDRERRERLEAQLLVLAARDDVSTSDKRRALSVLPDTRAALTYLKGLDGPPRAPAHEINETLWELRATLWSWPGDRRPLVDALQRALSSGGATAGALAHALLGLGASLETLAPLLYEQLDEEWDWNYRGSARVYALFGCVDLVDARVIDHALDAAFADARLDSVWYAPGLLWAFFGLPLPGPQLARALSLMDIWDEDPEKFFGAPDDTAAPWRALLRAGAGEWEPSMANALLSLVRRYGDVSYWMNDGEPLPATRDLLIARRAAEALAAHDAERTPLVACIEAARADLVRWRQDKELNPVMRGSIDSLLTIATGA